MLVQRPFSRTTWVVRYQNVSILDLIGAKDDGGDGDNWNYKTRNNNNNNNSSESESKSG